MRKEFTKMTRQIFNENMEATGELEEVIFISLIADTGKRIKSLETGIMGTRVDLGTDDSEENYVEVSKEDY